MNIRSSIKDLTPYIPGKLLEGAIKLASNENPLGPSPLALEALRNAIGEVSLYPDGGCVKLKQKLAASLSLTPENIILGNGSDEVLTLIAGAYIEPGEKAITSESTFSEYTFATRLFGGQMIYAPMENGTFQLDKIASLTDSSVKLIFLCNPNNPTGTYFSRSALEQFMKNVPKSILVVLDEAYVEYVSCDDFPSSLELLNKFDNLIILRTFSKIYGLAGCRVGYGISTTKVIADLNKARTPFNVNLLAQAAALKALDDTDFVARSRTCNEEGKVYLYKQLERLNLSYFPTQSNFIFLYVKRDCMVMFETLMQLGITVRPMRSFGYKDALRVTIGTAEQNKFFISCLEKALVTVPMLAD